MNNNKHSIQIDRTLSNQVKSYAKIHGYRLSGFVEMILKAYLQQALAKNFVETTYTYDVNGWTSGPCVTGTVTTDKRGNRLRTRIDG